MAAPKSRLLPLAILAVVAFATPLVAAEIVARLFLAQAQGLFHDPGLRKRDQPFLIDHPTRGFALAPGFHNELYHINGRGLRGDELPEDLARRFVLLVAGESTIFGYGVKDGATLPAQLQRQLDERPSEPPVYVVNAGVPSYTASQVRLYLPELIDALAPDLVLVSSQWNDLWFSILRPWYPELLVFQQPSPWRAFLMRHSAVYRAVMARRGDGASDAVNREALDYYRQNLEAIADLCAERGVPLVFVHAPFDLGLMSDRGFTIFGFEIGKAFFRELADAHAAILDEVGASRGVPVIHHPLAEGAGHERMFVDLLHASRRGNALIAATVAQFLEDRRLLPPAR